MREFLDISQLFAKAIEKAYRDGEDDYNMRPIVLKKSENEPIGTINSGDSVVFCCKRGEREIQLTDCFVAPDFPYFERKNFSNLYFALFTLYHAKYLTLSLPVAFKPSIVNDTLGEVISKTGLKQLRIAESEKFAHVTFFFNGNSNRVFMGEEDMKIPSPSGIPFEKVPALSLEALSRRLIEEINRDKYQFILANFANGDVIGHTTNFEAKVSCVKEINKRLKAVVEEALLKQYTVIVTADHGVLEVGYKNGKPNVSHTTNPVPFILINPALKSVHLKKGKLANIAPTVLDLMGIRKPKFYEESLFEATPFLKSQKILLIVLDGWGIGEANENNPIYVAKPIFYNSLLKEYPWTTLDASGESVGLKAGQSGNSEAGHMNIGAGRVILQDDVIIEKSIEDGSFFLNPVFKEAIQRLDKTKRALHLIGLLSCKSSHGTVDYFLNVLKIAKSFNFENVFLHLILDGRSTEPGSAPALIRSLGKTLHEIGIGTIVTVVGRGYALDRNGDYAKKTKVAYDAMVFGIGRAVYYNFK